MPLQKLTFRPGLYREGTSYSNEGGWYDGDKVRFRSGLPEKIGGWTQVNSNQFTGLCRSLWTWVDLSSNVFIGVGTTSKYYIYSGGTYNDITPIVYTSTLTATAIATTASSTLVTITDLNYSPSAGDYVNFTTSATVGGLTISGEYVVSGVTSTTAYTINASSNASSTATGGPITVQYELPSGSATYSTSNGWGTGPWGGISTPLTATLGTNPFSTTSGSGVVIVSQASTPYTLTGQFVAFTGATSITGTGIPASMLNSTFSVTPVSASSYSITMPSSFTAKATTTGGGSAVVALEQSGTRGWGTVFTGTGAGTQLRLWTNDNFGQDLVIAPRSGSIYYWQDSNGVGTRAVSLASLANSTASTITNASFASATASVVVSAPAGIYPYAYVSGTGIPANTQVSSSYVIGNTTVPLTQSTTASSAGTNLTFTYAGSYVPTQTLQVITSAIQEFVIAFGANSYNGGSLSNDAFNPMLVRWSDQANAYQWIPQTTNQSGEFALSNGSYIMGARATRQEILIWTNTALYTMQYIGYPYVWSFNILMDNISVMSPNCMITINNITYWMGTTKFYKYDGTVHTLPSALRQYVFDDLNINQAFQVFAGANEGFNEVWWFYVSNESINNSIDKYVIYNYIDNAWSYGTFETVTVTAGSFVIGQQYVINTVGTTNFTAIGAANNNVGTYFVATGVGSGTGTAWAMNGRSAWLESNIQSNPVAADYNNRLLYHESGVDDNATSKTQPIYAYIQSSDFGIMASDQNNSGQHFGFVWRLLPDVNFNGSNVANPQVTMAMYPRQNSGTAYGTTDLNSVTSSQTYGYPTPQEYTIQQFTGEVYTRLRGRQLAFKCYSNTIGTQWQLGTTRYDVKQDGRR